VYGLTGQLRRAAVSIASNIAEGRGRLTDGDFRNFLGIAQGSTYEVQTQLVIARRLNFGSPQEITACEGLSEEISKMLTAFIASLPRKS
jgi:four helix bundle protein